MKSLIQRFRDFADLWRAHQAYAEMDAERAKYGGYDDFEDDDDSESGAAVRPAAHPRPEEE